MEYAIIETGGRQYRVSHGQKLTVGYLEGKEGAAIIFDKVLFLGGKENRTGSPTLEGAKVTAKIVAQKKAPKIVIYKYKRRKGYHKKQGHRQLETCVEITDIK